MDLDNPVIKLCIEGTQAEFQGQVEKARSLYRKAWEVVQDDYDACIAAHYVARLQDNHNERLYWNQIALDKANAITDSRVQEFYPSLFLNMGQSYELLGDLNEAKRYYDLAAALGVIHQDDQDSISQSVRPVRVSRSKTRDHAAVECTAQRHDGLPG